MSLPIGVKASFSESELSLHETIRKLTRERDSALHLVAGLEVQVLELELSKEDSFTVIFQRGIADLEERFSKRLEDQKKENEAFKQLVAPLLVERQIRLEKEAAEKEAEEKEAALSFVLNSGWGQRGKEKLRQGTLAQIKAVREYYEKEGAVKFGTAGFWRAFLEGTIPFPMEEPV